MDTVHEFNTGSGGAVTLIQGADCHGFGIREETDCVVVIASGGTEHRLGAGECWRIDRAGMTETEPPEKPKKPKKPKDKEPSSD